MPKKPDPNPNFKKVVIWEMDLEKWDIILLKVLYIKSERIEMRKW